jgi:hypothetical protein
MNGFFLEGRDRTEDVVASRGQWFDPNLLILEPPLNVAVKALPQSLITVGNAFRANLVAARHGVSLPFNVLFGNYLMIARQKYYHDCLVPRLAAEPGATPERAKAIRDTLSDEAFLIYSNSDVLHSETIRTLVNLPVLAHHGAINVSAPLILRQAVKETWTAFEVLANDLFFAATDANPDILNRVQNDADVAKALRVSPTLLATLSEWPMIREKHLNQLPAMRNAYKGLLPANTTVLNILQDAKLNILMQNRHILVHQAGKINQNYIDKTHELVVVGETLSLKPSYVAETLTLVRDSGITLLHEVSRAI